jgi:type IV pilus assembly protein PilM
MRLQLTKKSAVQNVVGLDIEAGSIAATEVRINGAVQIAGCGVAPLPAGAFHEGEIVDADALADALRGLFAERKLAKQVRLGVANQRVVVRTVRLPAIEDPKELAAAVRFQAQEQIPMPLDQAVLDHQVVGGVAGEDGSAPQVDVIVVAARREMVSSLVEPIRRAGLEPVGIDLSAFAMIRALAGTDASVAEPGERPPAAVLYCSIGDLTNLAVARGRSCLFTRVSHVGLESVAAELGTARGLLPEHAAQWLEYVGLERPEAEIEGDPEIVAAARRALENGTTGLIDELRLSLDYYGAQEAALPVERIVLCGPGSAIAGLPARMEERLGLPIAASLPAALAGFDAPLAARLTLSLGLALEH